VQRVAGYLDLFGVRVRLIANDDVGITLGVSSFCLKARCLAFLDLG
jgi:hypothetical protein